MRKIFISLSILLFTIVVYSCGKDTTTSSKLLLIENDQILCNVVCPDGSSIHATNAANEICAKLKALSGENCSVKSSSQGTDALEIIVGDEAYPAAEKEYLSYTYGYYLASNQGKKIIVAAHDSAAYKSLSADFTTVLANKYSAGNLELYSSDLPKSAGSTVKGFIPPYICSSNPIYILQSGAVTPDDTAMQVAYESMTSTDFQAYCSSLESQGYVKMSENSDNGNVYASYSNNKYLVSVSFYGGTTKLFSIVSERDYEDSKIWSISGTKGSNKVLMMQVYQDNVTYTDKHPGGYVVRLSDGRYFLYDTGHTITADQMMDYMRSRNCFTDGKVHIAMIIISHPHGDHMDGLSRFVAKFKDEIVCESVCYNMTNHTRQSTYSESSLSARVNKIYYAGKDLGAICHCLRAGQKFDLAGTSVEVLFTPDELGTYFLSGKDDSGETSTYFDQNNSSNLVRINVDGQEITFTGDCRGGEAKIFNNLVKPVFSSDIMTAAHHGFNVSETLQMYLKAKPFVIFWPVRTDEQDMTRYFDQQLMQATWVKKHFFEDSLVEIELPYSIE